MNIPGLDRFHKEANGITDVHPIPKPDDISDMYQAKDAPWRLLLKNGESIFVKGQHAKILDALSRYMEDHRHQHFTFQKRKGGVHIWRVCDNKTRTHRLEDILQQIVEGLAGYADLLEVSDNGRYALEGIRKAKIELSSGETGFEE